MNQEQQSPTARPPSRLRLVIGIISLLIAVLFVTLWWRDAKNVGDNFLLPVGSVSYMPDTPSQTHHGITVRLLQVSHTPDATSLQFQILSPSGMEGGRPAGGREPVLYDNLGHVYRAPHRTIPRVTKTTISAPSFPTPSSTRTVSLRWEDVRTSVSDQAQSLTYIIPELTFQTRVGKEFTLDLGDQPHAGQTWPLDMSFDVAGLRVRIQRARLVRNSAKQRNELVLEIESESNPSLRLQLLSLQSPELPDAAIAGDRYGRVHAHLFTKDDRSPAGLIHIQIPEAEIGVTGPWRFQWSIPDHDVALKSVITHPQTQVSHKGVTLRLDSAVFTDRLIALQLDAETPTGQRFIDVDWQKKSGLHDEFGRTYDFNRDTLWCWDEVEKRVPVDNQAEAPLSLCLSRFHARLTFQPAHPLARRFTLTIPGVRLFTPDAVSIDLSVPRNLAFDETWQGNPAASWPVDIPLSVAGYDIHFTQARLLDSLEPELQLISEPVDLRPQHGRIFQSLDIETILADGQEIMLSWRGSAAVVEGVDCRVQPDVCADAPKRLTLNFAPVMGLPDSLPRTYHIVISGAEVVQTGKWVLHFNR